MENEDVETLDKKFMFDMNLFDEEEEEEDENLPPPPPVFSEAELEAAKKVAHSEGYEQATQDQKASREQATSTTLAKLAQNVAPLFIAEEERETRYEQEAVNLTLKTFKTLFPFYAEKCGFDELKAVLSDVLERQRTIKTLTVFTAPDTQEGVEKHIKETCAHHRNIAIEVLSDDTLGGTACRLSWKDGGAMHSPQKTAEDTLAILQQTLAQDGFTSHDDTTSLDGHQTISKKDAIVEGNAATGSEASPQKDKNPPEAGTMEKPDE